MEKMVIADEMIFDWHSITPVCPHCYRQSSSGPMGLYELWVTCEYCKKEYVVTCRMGGKSMKYRWELPKKKT
jgi:hypothetical protein